MTTSSTLARRCLPALGVDEHRRHTLVFEDDKRTPLVILMHGDRKVSTKGDGAANRRQTRGALRACRCLRHSGYQVGGCSPFRLCANPCRSTWSAPSPRLPAFQNQWRTARIFVGHDAGGVMRALAPTLVDAALAGDPATEGGPVEHPRANARSSPDLRDAAKMKRSGHADLDPLRENRATLFAICSASASSSL